MGLTADGLKNRSHASEKWQENYYPQRENNKMKKYILALDQGTTSSRV
jgi:hypothetical protein